MADGFAPAPISSKRKKIPKIIWWLIVAGLVYLIVSGDLLKNCLG